MSYSTVVQYVDEVYINRFIMISHIKNKLQINGSVNLAVGVKKVESTGTLISLMMFKLND